jgi:hypothetical protein
MSVNATVPGIHDKIKNIAADIRRGTGRGASQASAPSPDFLEENHN